MMRYARDSNAPGFIIGTETGILHRLKKENPAKYFVPVTDKAVCPNMKRITLEKVLWSLQDMKHQIIMPEDIRVRALNSVRRMLAIH
jgi:quinolinate synthase